MTLVKLQSRGDNTFEETKSLELLKITIPTRIPAPYTFKVKSKTPKKKSPFLIFVAIFAHSQHRSRPRSGRPPRLRAAAPRTTLQLHPTAYRGAWPLATRIQVCFGIAVVLSVTVATFLIRVPLSGIRVNDDGVFVDDFLGCGLGHHTLVNVSCFFSIHLN